MADPQHPPPSYQADDRSLLLPLYRRVLLEPLVRRLPASIHPNTITHAGHAACLLALLILMALRPQQGAPLVAAAALLQFYLWCDNADGLHARRTGQCSPYGELLDHGLDILNVVYIALMTCLALALPAGLWVALVLLITGAAALTYWEQAQTGVFRLGLMSQLESGAVLSLVLCVGAALGTAWWRLVEVAGVRLQLWLVLWPAATILFGMARSIARVVKARGLASLDVIGWLGGYALAVAVAAASGFISTTVAVVLAVSGNVYFSMRMLSLRLHGEPPPHFSRALSFGTIGLVTITAFQLGSHGTVATPTSAHFDTALAFAAATFFSLGALRDARRGIVRAERGDV